MLTNGTNPWIKKLSIYKDGLIFVIVVGTVVLIWIITNTLYSLSVLSQINILMMNTNPGYNRQLETLIYIMFVITGSGFGIIGIKNGVEYVLKKDFGNYFLILPILVMIPIFFFAPFMERFFLPSETIIFIIAIIGISELFYRKDKRNLFFHIFVILWILYLATPFSHSIIYRF